MRLVVLTPLHNQILAIINDDHHGINAEDMQQRLQAQGIESDLRPVKKTLMELCDMLLIGGARNPWTDQDEFWRCK